MPTAAVGQITITDLKDTVGLVLSKEAMTVAAAPDGTVASLSGVATTANVLLGGVDDSANWALTAGTPSGMTGALSGKTYTVTGVSADTAYVDLTASRTGFASLTKRFSVSKSRQGAVGAAGATGAPGVDGTSPVVVTLTNTAHTVPTDSAGNNGNFSGCATTLNVFNGITNDSANWTVTAAATNLTGSLSGKTYTVTALSADSGYVDLTAARSGFTSQTVRFTVTKAKAGVAGENFVINYATSELWTADTSNAQALGKYGGNFTVNGDGNQRVWATDPFGRPALTWRTVGNDAASDSDGGWDKAITGLDPEKSYMSVVYVRRLSASTNGRFYHGCGKSGSTVTVGGAASSNPYFANGTDISSFDTLDWYVSIGFIKANADGSASSTQGGLYKLSTGGKVSAYSDFRMAAGATTQSHRTYLYYSTDPNASLEWWGPGFFEINGNEPKLRDLVGNPEWYNGNIALGSDGTLSGGGGGKVTIGGLGYTGALDANKTSVDAGGALQGVASGAGTVVSNAQIGINASGQLYGAGAGNGTAISNAQISVDPATGVIGGIGTGAGTAVANSQVAFSARQTWEFRGSAEGWITTNASITANADTITVTATGGNPQLGLVGLNINGATYDKVRVRIRRVAGTGWRGVLFYGTSARSYSESYKKVLLDSVASTGFVVIEFDMANLTAGGADWKSNTITSLRFDLGNVTGDAFEIDWVSVGKYGHDVDLVLSASSQIVAGTETNGVILDAATKSLQVVAGGNERVRLGNQAAAVNGSAYGFVVKDNSGNVVFDSRNAVGIVGNQTYDNFNVGDITTNPVWDGNTGGTGNLALGARALQGDGLTPSTGRTNNIAIGTGALRYTQTSGNIGIGIGALRGVTGGNIGAENIAIGYNAMLNANVANYNIGIGRTALRDISAGTQNLAVGYESMQVGTNAAYNVALGHQTLKKAQSYNNTAVGYQAGTAQTSPSDNTLIGYKAGTFITTGGSNTVLGSSAGFSISTGSGNTLLGAGADAGQDTNNQTIIASGAGVVLRHGGTLLETSHNISSGGNITASGTVKGSALTVEGSGPLIRLLDTDVTQSNFWIHANNSKFYVLTDYDYDSNWDTPYPLVLDNATTTANIYGSKAWTAGNDGADSGLDADLLDGQHGSYYLNWANFTGKPTSPQGFSMVPEEMGANVDLDTKTTTGWYSQANTTEATVALHYPVALAGLLEVFAYSAMIHQRYWVYNSNDVYYRAKYSTDVWTAWIKSANVDDNVATATKLAASKTINGVAFDGSANITVADSTKLSLSGGTMTGAIAFAAAQTWPTFNQSTTGSAASLTTARTLTIGSTGKTFNGTAGVSWTLAEIGAAPATHSHTMPAVGDWFNGGYMSIRSDGVMQAGKYLDWHNATTDTTATGRTTVDSTGLLTHSEGLKVKGTGGLGYAFGGAVTQLTSRDTGVTLDTPSGRITLASVAVTAGTRNKFTLTNSCIANTDVVVVSMQAPGAGTFVVSVNRVAAGSCDIVIQNLDTITAAAPSLNFAIIKGSNS